MDLLKVKEFLESVNLKDEDFTYLQKGQIYIGLRNKLPTEKMLLFMKPEINDKIMGQIREGLENGLTMEQISIYNRPEYDRDQMREIRMALERGISKEQIEKWINPEFDFKQIEQIIDGLTLEMPEEKMAIYARPEYDPSQMEVIQEGLCSSLSTTLVSLYTNPELEWNVMSDINYQLQNLNKIDREILEKKLKTQNLNEILTDLILEDKTINTLLVDCVKKILEYQNNEEIKDYNKESRDINNEEI
jgi:hypothetical protein